MKKKDLYSIVSTSAVVGCIGMLLTIAEPKKENEENHKNNYELCYGIGLFGIALGTSIMSSIEEKKERYK